MVAKLPASRVVDVTLTRADRFPSRRGFQVQLILTPDTTGPLDATTRTKVYGTIEEVAVDYASTTSPYLAALSAFSQNPRPRQIKLGWYDGVGVATITDELDAIYAFDSDWYWMTHDAALRDDATDIPLIMAWAEAKKIQFLSDTNDVDTENAADATSITALGKAQGYDRSATFYHTDAAEYGAAALYGYTATRDFDRPNTAYTAKFKYLRGVAPLNIASAGVQAVTGFVPSLGLQDAAGQFANTYVDINGARMVVEGNMLSKAFIDEIHASDWIVARLQEEMIGAFTTNDRIAMDDGPRGMEIPVAAVEGVFNRAAIAGLIADVFDADSGEFLPAYVVTPQSVEAIPASQRRNRILPDIAATFRYAGAGHYASVNVLMQF